MCISECFQYKSIANLDIRDFSMDPGMSKVICKVYQTKVYGYQSGPAKSLLCWGKKTVVFMYFTSLNEDKPPSPPRV